MPSKKPKVGGGTSEVDGGVSEEQRNDRYQMILTFNVHGGWYLCKHDKLMLIICIFRVNNNLRVIKAQIFVALKPTLHSLFFVFHPR